MQGLKERFDGYGADYVETMRRFLGNEAMYLKFLKKLFQDDNLKKLGQALENGDLTGAFEAAHTLKGVTGNLGLTRLYQAVCAIVEPLRLKEARDYAPMYDEICSEFDRVKQILLGQEGGDDI